jgi:glycosyltransferase involved in cell wall biosynthesis
LTEVSIGLCVKDSERIIKQSLGSIINQNYPPDLMQLIVVDGCSKDNTLSIIKKAISKTRIKLEVYSDEGRGLGTARQIILKNARGKYIIFVDDDIMIFRDFVRNHVKFMDENPYLGAAFGTPTFQKGKLFATIWGLANYAVGGGVGMGGSICRCEALRQIGGFDTKIKGAAEDRDLFIRLKLGGWGMSVNKMAKYAHKHRESIRSFLIEQSWFGYGDHYLNHKYRNLSSIWHDYINGCSSDYSLDLALFVGVVDALWRKIPAGDFVWGIKLASKAYKLTHKKIAFLIIPQMILANISWWAGFAKAHKDGYGHEVNVS